MIGSGQPSSERNQRIFVVRSSAASCSPSVAEISAGLTGSTSIRSAVRRSMSRSLVDELFLSADLIRFAARARRALDTGFSVTYRPGHSAPSNAGRAASAASAESKKPNAVPARGSGRPL